MMKSKNLNSDPIIYQLNPREIWTLVLIREKIEKHLKTLDHTRHNLVLQTWVLTLRVLPDHHNIHILMPRGQSREIKAMNERRVEVQFLPQLHVEGTDSPTNRGGEPALEAHLVPPDRLDHLRRHRGHVPVDLVRLEIHRRVHRLHHPPHGAGDEGADPVSRDQGHRPRRAVAGPRHVGNGAAAHRRWGGGSASEDLAEERRRSPHRRGFHRSSDGRGAGLRGTVRENKIAESEGRKRWKGWNDGDGWWNEAVGEEVSRVFWSFEG